MKRNSFEMKAHDMSVRKKKQHIDHGQLGDNNRFFEKHFDPTVFIATTFLATFALVALAVIYGIR